MSDRVGPLSPMLAGWLLGRIDVDELHRKFVVVSIKPAPPNGILINMRSGAQFLVAVTQVGHADAEDAAAKPKAPR